MVSPVVMRVGFGRWLVQSSDADGNPHRSPIQAVTMMKIPSANTVVSTMMPMISSPHGNKSRAITTSAYMENQRFTRRGGNRLPAMSSFPVLIRCCQDSSAKRSRFSHFRHRGATPSRPPPSAGPGHRVMKKGGPKAAPRASRPPWPCYPCTSCARDHNQEAAKLRHQAEQHEPEHAEVVLARRDRTSGNP
jgi:hypothetical protein